jgi:DNA-binding PadR family transcriptional regulator
VHGAGLTDDFAHHGIRISPGTLYPALHRMEAEGLLTARNQVVNGHARRVYQATEAGRAVLADLGLTSDGGD